MPISLPSARTKRSSLPNNEEDPVVVGETSARDAIEAGLEAGTMTTKPPESLAMISWNIDGLAEKNLKKRTKAVCKIIEMEKADVVFLQEVIPETFSYIEDKLPGYHCVACLLYTSDAADE